MWNYKIDVFLSIFTLKCCEMEINIMESLISKNESNIILYHGSKSGIKGKIQPISRELCDFGKGFYMGTEKMQPLTLICNFPQATLYTLELDVTGLNILEKEVGLEWALLIAYYRGKMDFTKGSDIYQKYSSMAKGYDMIIGDIANDRMFVVLDRFFAGDITDVALIKSLSALKLGKQYVAISKKGCEKIKIIDEEKLCDLRRERLQLESEEHRRKGIQQAEEICRKYRREGRFYDEILGGEVNGSNVR